MSFISRLFAPEFLIPKEKRLGELPDGKKVYKTALKIVWPALIEMVLITLINMVDTVMVGVLGHEAIAAVGLVNQPRFIVLASFMAIGVATTAIVARRRGENDSKGAKECLAACLTAPE